MARREALITQIEGLQGLNQSIIILDILGFDLFGRLTAVALRYGHPA
jgi:hypothetical protein